MSTKMKVRYGHNAVAITEVPDDDFVVDYKVYNDAKEIVARHAFDFAEVPASNLHKVTSMGGNKILTDRTSDTKDKVAKLAEMKDVFALLVSGEWAKEKAVGAVEVSVFVEALAQLKKMSIPDTQASLGQYEKDTRAAILAREDVQTLGKAIAAKRDERTLTSLDDMVPATS